MATVTVTLGNDPILAVYNINTIAFDFDRGTATGTYAKVVVDGYSFLATKIATVGTVDTYSLNVSSVLKNLIPLPPTDSALTNLLAVSKTFTVNGYSSAGAILATTNFTSKLTYGYSHIGDDYGYQMIFGGRDFIFHNGVISFWFDGTGGTHPVTINSTTVNYAIVNGWNKLTLHASHLISGTLTINAGGATVIFDVIYRNISLENIEWINTVGCWDAWAGFTKLTTISDVSIDTAIPIYSASHAGALAYDLSIGRSKTTRILLECIAINDVQYKQFVAMAESQVILYNAKLWRVAEANNSVGECRQNLNFRLTLEITDNVPTY